MKYYVYKLLDKYVHFKKRIVFDEMTQKKMKYFRLDKGNTM